jgi:hypothetical protein
VLLRRTKGLLKWVLRPIYHRLLARLRRDLESSPAPLRAPGEGGELERLRQALADLSREVAELGRREPRLRVLQDEVRAELDQMARSCAEFHLYLTQQVADQMIRLGKSGESRASRPASEAA